MKPFNTSGKAAAVAAVSVAAALVASTGMSESKKMPGIINATPTDWAALPRALVTDEPFMKMISGKGAQVASRVSYSSSDKRWVVDASAYDQMTVELKDWPGDEFMYFIEGRVQITDTAGHSTTYGPGDSIVMPKGFTGTWKQLSAIKKLSVIYLPESPAR